MPARTNNEGTTIGAIITYPFPLGRCGKEDEDQIQLFLIN
jgi:hypothetical protein